MHQLGMCNAAVHSVLGDCWILAGEAHHTVLSYDCDAEMMQDWARMMGTEFVHINTETDPVKFKQKLFIADLA